MIKRTAVIALGFTLAACNQGAPPAGETQTAAPGDAPVGDPATEDANLLAGTMLQGSWEPVGDEAEVGVRFTSPDNPDTLTIGCNQGSGDAFITWTPRNPIAITNPADERFPTQDGEMRIYTAAEALTFAATGSNIDGHMVSSSVPGSDRRLAVLKARQDRFAVQAFGQSIIVPWDPSIAATLNDCAG